MNLQELERAKAMKDRLNKVGSGFVWQSGIPSNNAFTQRNDTQLSLPRAPYKVSVEEVQKNYKAIAMIREKLRQRACMLNGERPKPGVTIAESRRC